MKFAMISLLGGAALLLLAAAAAPVKAPKVSAPLSVESLLTQAHEAESKGQSELALRLAQSAIVADPARPGSYVALGDIYAKNGQADFARTYYDEALNIDPSEASALKALAALNHKNPAATAEASP